VNAAPDLNADDDSLLAAGDIIDSRYRVEEIIGRGGMGLVASAVHMQLGRRVAIKLLVPKAAGSDVAHERFLREARAAAHLRNEHVVQVLDFGILENGSPVIVMELLKGYDLERTLIKRGPLPIIEAVDFLLQACEAVAEAHAHGLVHRDIKPSNLFVSHAADGSPHIKVLDFGVSKLVRGAESESGFREQSLTGSRMVVGSPAYMAPEQVSCGGETDARTDVWALGVTLFELLTETRPFDAASVPLAFASIMRDSPPLLRARCLEAPHQLEELVQWCLEKDPAKRCPDVVTFAKRLADAFPSPLRSEVAARIERLAKAASVESDSDRLTLVQSSQRRDSASTSAWTLTPRGQRSAVRRRFPPPLRFVAGGTALLLLVGAVIWGVISLDRSASPPETSAAPLPSMPASTAEPPSLPPAASSAAAAASTPDAQPSQGPAAASRRLPPKRDSRTLDTPDSSTSDPPSGTKLGRNPLEDRK